MTDRVRLDDHRTAYSAALTFTREDGIEIPFTATYGTDDGHAVREIFCLAFKSGTELQTLLHQSCIGLSLGLQHGMPLSELAHAMGEDNPAQKPRSILGLTVRAGLELEAELRGERK